MARGWWRLGRLERSLRARILLPTAVLFAATLAAMAAAAVRLDGVNVEREHQAKAEAFTEMLAEGLTNAMLDGHTERVPQLLDALAEHRSDILWISLLNSTGEVVSSTRPELIGTRSLTDDRPAHGLARIADPAGTKKQFAMTRPLENREACASCHGVSSRVNGWLDLHFTREPALASQRRLLHALAWPAAAAFLLLVGIAWWLVGREAVGPLQRLVAAMRRAQQGEPDVRADDGRPDELGTAARCFDGTLAALRNSRSELEAFYRERMVRADRFAAVGELATGLAHEIKNPLAGLSGALELMAEDLSGSPHAEIVGEMRHQVARLTHTMESLLGFARPPRARLRSTDLAETLDKILSLVARQKGSSRFRVERQVAAVPEVLADPAQLEQVLLNLCLNACQAMGERGGTLSARAWAEGEGVVVEIADTGPGIPVDLRPRLFTPFVTTKRDGNGLGLAISARILADHGGHIDYRCPESGGTVFTVRLRQAAAAGWEATT